MPECNNDLRKIGRATPRTCAKCGLGPCHANASVHGSKPVANPFADSHGILGFACGVPGSAAVLVGPAVTAAGVFVDPATPRASGLSKATEAAMELALIRPDLVSLEQVQTLAQALKNATVGRANLANLEAAMRQSQAANQSYHGHGMQVLPGGGIAHR